MKLSLTFEPFVKPQYKEFCITKIQQCVSQIKQHFKFSRKQNIYEPHPKKIPQFSCNSKFKEEALKKTVKKQFTFENQQYQDSPCSQTQKINFEQEFSERASSQRKETACFNHRKYSVSSNNSQQIQQLQMVEFMTKIETTLDDHTTFYQNIMEKTQLMNKKQLYLQKLISELKALSNENQSSQKTRKKGSSPKKPIEQSHLSSLTFRNSNIFDQDKQNQYSDQKYKDSPPQKRLNEDKNSVLHSNSKYKEVKQKKVKEQGDLVNEELENYQKDKAINIRQKEAQQGQKSISQSADFLISFMKLEQQFNKIKKKGAFQTNNFQDGRKSGLTCVY